MHNVPIHLSLATCELRATKLSDDEACITGPIFVDNIFAKIPSIYLLDDNKSSFHAVSQSSSNRVSPNRSLAAILARPRSAVTTSGCSRSSSRIAASCVAKDAGVVAWNPVG